MATLNFRIYQKTDSTAQFSLLLENKKLKTSLLFQSGTVAELSVAETDAIRSDHYARISDSYGCLGVVQYCPRENTELYLVVITRCVKVCTLLGTNVYKIQEVDVIALHSPRPPGYKSQDDDPWMKELKKLLGSESFYFGSGTTGRDDQAPVLDLTLCAQRRAKSSSSDNRFFWNRMLHLHPKRFNIDCDRWLVKVMCGSVEFSSIYMNNHSPKLYIISRLSCERAGTRFMIRGVDDEGHVANFVETEQLIHVETLDNLVVSYVQIRGTVPLFWEQPGLNVGSHKVKMSREPSISSIAFGAHMKYLREKYGRQVIVNLLGTGVTGKSQGEAALSHLFQLQHNNCTWSRDCPHIVFDFHQECRGGNTENLLKRLLPQIAKEVQEFGFFWQRNNIVNKTQSGTMRTNCLDCLDRTNRIQTFLGLQLLDAIIEVMGTAAEGGVAKLRFTTKLEEMWKENGNKISQIYAGTGALQGSKLIDGARSVGRTIQNNLLDQNKQEAIDILLHGNLLNNYLAVLSRSLLPQHLLYAPIPVLKATCERAPEFSSSFPLKVCVGTYNVNGGKHFRSLAYKHLSLDDWLLDAKKNAIADSLVHTSADWDTDDERPPDLFAIGFEEIVDLNASNIVANTQWSENANSWGHELQKVISRDEAFVMVTWAQLVGVALFVFVNERHAQFVKHVNVRTVKTGMQGNTGNKGGVGIRMVVRNTSIAFVCSHFAAGQKEVNERNQDYDSIARKMVFGMGTPLWAHDYVFWCGDFNYRISLGREEVLDLVQRKEWELLQLHDQLIISQKENKCFKGFVEGRIQFPPTYKYDLFSDDYDTSEKARVPAWTDRVLFWRRRYDWDHDKTWSPGTISHYGCAALKQSDHRPVLATINVQGRTVVPHMLDTVYKSVVESLGPSDCTVLVQCVTCSASEELSDEVLEAAQHAMDAVGALVMVRFVDNKIWFTFDSSTLALQAVRRSPIKLDGHELTVCLKTECWREQLEEEISLCSDSAVPLGEQESVPTVTIVNGGAPSGGLLRTEASGGGGGLLRADVHEVLGQLYSSEGFTPSPFPSPCPSPTPDDEPEDEESDTPRPVPSRPAPPRPLMPSRPPPPRPTPPASPNVQRPKAKVVVLSKPLPARTPPPPVSASPPSTPPLSLEDMDSVCASPSLPPPMLPPTPALPTPAPPILPPRTPSADSSSSGSSTPAGINKPDSESVLPLPSCPPPPPAIEDASDISALSAHSISPPRPETNVSYDTSTSDLPPSLPPPLDLPPCPPPLSDLPVCPPPPCHIPACPPPPPVTEFSGGDLPSCSPRSEATKNPVLPSLPPRGAPPSLPLRTAGSGAPPPAAGGARSLPPVPARSAGVPPALPPRS